MKTRIISAVVALLILVPLILLGGIYFKIGVCILALLAYKEIIDLKKSHNLYPKVIIAIGAVLLILLILANNIGGYTYIGVPYPLLALTIILLIVPIIFYKNDKYTHKDAFFLLASVLFLSMAFNSCIRLRDYDLYLFIYLLLIPILTDTFAYFTGLTIGKHKIGPISPKKSWEGCVGGLIFGSVGSLVFYHFLVGNITWKIVLYTIILSIIGQMGDLVMSKIKRENEIKDFSNIMPGHGGILDRLDSIIFVVLTYIFLLSL